MLPVALKCSAVMAVYAEQLPKSFLFLPNACPPTNGRANAKFGTLLSCFFSIAYCRLALTGVPRVTPQSCPPASTQLYEQTTRQIPPLTLRSSSPAPSFHSYRRISTGNNRAAARAGKIVAPIEMPIAASVIHTPSSALG